MKQICGVMGQNLKISSTHDSNISNPDYITSNSLLTYLSWYKAGPLQSVLYNRTNRLRQHTHTTAHKVGKKKDRKQFKDYDTHTRRSDFMGTLITLISRNCFSFMAWIIIKKLCFCCILLEVLPICLAKTIASCISNIRRENFTERKIYISTPHSQLAQNPSIKWFNMEAFCTYWRVFQTLGFWSGFPGWPQQITVPWQSCRGDPRGSLAEKSPQWSDKTELQRCETRSPQSHNPGKMKQTERRGCFFLQYVQGLLWTLKL